MGWGWDGTGFTCDSFGVLAENRDRSSLFKMLLAEWSPFTKLLSGMLDKIFQLIRCFEGLNFYFHFPRDYLTH